MAAVPRGIRNNNPLNIRIGNNWVGEVKTPTDPLFEQFESMEYGIRAAFIILKKYINRYKRNNIWKIIDSWAPPHENNSKMYAEFVGLDSGINPEEELQWTDKDKMIAIVNAMIQVECGQRVDKETIEKGYDLARGF